MKLSGRLAGIGNAAVNAQPYMNAQAYYTVIGILNYVAAGPSGYTRQSRVTKDGTFSYGGNPPSALTQSVQDMAKATGATYDIYARWTGGTSGIYSYDVQIIPAVLPADAPKLVVADGPITAPPQVARVTRVEVAPNYSATENVYSGESQKVDLQAMFASNQAAADTARQQYAMPSEVASDTAETQSPKNVEPDNGLLKLALIGASLFLMG